MFRRLRPVQLGLKSGLNPSLLERFSARRRPLDSALSLVVGLGVVAWRATVGAEAARAIARIEVRALASFGLHVSKLVEVRDIRGA